MKTKLKRILCIILALIMTLSLFTACGRNDNPAEREPEQTERPQQAVYKLTDADVNKEETVFINLSPDGTVKKVSVTDKLHTAMPQVRIEDSSDLEDIADVKTFIEPVFESGKMFWDMESTDLYYSGVSEKKPPIDIRVQYLLDGKEISYTELSGKSGEVTINIDIKNELTKTVKADGKKYTVECPMLFLCGMILPDESFGNVAAEKGIVFGDGTHKLVAFMGVPGMNESLGIDELGLDFLGDSLGGSSYTLKADAKDFAIGNLMFVAVPFSSVRALGFKDIGTGVDGFKDILTDLEGLLGTFASLDLEDMIQVLYGDAAQIEKLINSVGEAFELYEQNKALLELLDRFMTEGNLDKLEKLTRDLEKLDTKRLDSLTNLAPFTQLLDLIGRLDKNIAGLSQLAKDYLQISPMLSELNAELETAEIKNALDDLPKTLIKLRELISVMRDSEELIGKTVKLFNSDSMKNIKALIDKIRNSDILNTLTNAQTEAISRRMKAWLNFGESYDIFTAKTNKQSSSVIFIYKMEAIG